MRIPTLAVGLLAAAGLAGAGCGDEPAAEPPAPMAEEQGPPPSLYPAGTPRWKQLPDKPAGPAPAREAGTARSFALQRVAAGLKMPNQVAARPGDDRLFVVEQGGTVRTLTGRRVGRRPWLDLRRRTRARGEQGLLSLGFDREGDTAYALLTDRRGDTRVLRIPVRRDGTAGRPEVVLAVDQPFENHNGGTVLVDERGRVVVGLGDGGSAFDPQERAQNSGDRLGKLLRWDPSSGTREWEVVAIGLRNPYRMSFDRATGRLWLGDVGQDRLEEVDAVYLPEEGAPTPNLGWAAYEGHLPLGTKRVAKGGRDLVWPVASYLHRDGLCSVTGGAVYRGARIAGLRGRYVYGDFCRGTLWSLAAEGEGDAVDLRREEARLPGLVAISEDGRGELLAVSIQGEVHRVVAP